MAVVNGSDGGNSSPKRPSSPGSPVDGFNGSLGSFSGENGIAKRQRFRTGLHMTGQHQPSSLRLQGAYGAMPA